MEIGHFKTDLQVNHFQKHCFFSSHLPFFMPNLKVFWYFYHPQGHGYPPMPAVLITGLVRTLRMSKMTPREAPVLKPLRHKKWKMGFKTMLLKMICLY